MKEPKPKRYSSPEEKMQAHVENENLICRCFENSPAHYGYDAVVFDVEVECIDDELLRSMEDSNTIVIRNEYADQSEENIFFRYKEISIYLPYAGELSLGRGDNYPYSSYTHLRITHGGLNVETISTNTLISKFKTACELFKKWGISLNPTKASFCTCELAFTFACNDILPLACRHLLIRSFSRDKNSLKSKPYKCTSTPKDIHLLASERYKNLKTGLYDKTAKAEHMKLISNKIKHLIRVYRLEQLLNKSKFKEVFGTNSLFEIKDSDITNYFRIQISAAIDYYVDTLYEDSLKATKENLKEAKTNNPKNIIAGLKDLLFAELAAIHTISVIDAEIFVSVDLHGIYETSNHSTRRHALIEAFNVPPKKASGKAMKFMPLDLFKNPIFQMVGWETERILNLMYTTLDNGLGCEMGTGANPPQVFKVSYGNFTQRSEYLNELIATPKKNVHLDIKEIVRDRIMNKWSDPNFILNQIDDK